MGKRFSKKKVICLHLGDLPELPLDKIAEYLSFKDLVNLAQAFHQLSHLKPKFQIKDIQNEGFEIVGPYDGHFAPELFLDVPVNTRGLISVKMSFKWKDQGWGNRKGQVWLRLVSGEDVIADCRSQYYRVAAHKWEHRQVEVEEHDVIEKAVKGDVLQVMRNAGGGGGHRLYVQNFKMRIIYKE